MPDYAIPILLIAAIAFWSAWREYAGRNRRDAALLGAFGTGTMLAGGALWFT